MKNNKVVKILLPMFVFCLANCDSENRNSTSPGSSNTLSSSISVTGTAVDINGIPVPGAKVAINDSNSSTDAGGGFVISTTAIGNTVTVNASAVGYTPQISIIKIKSGVSRYTVPIVLYAPQAKAFNAAQGTILSVKAMGNDLSVTVPPGAVSGNDPHSLRVTSFDPISGPAALQSASGALQSAGMVYVEIIDGNGNVSPLQLGNSMAISLAPSSPGAIQDAQPFQGWQLNGQEGKWGNPVAVSSPENGMTINAESFGYWNFDRNYKTACVTGTLVNSSGNKCGGSRVRADGPDGISSFDNSNVDGGFCVTGAQTWKSTLVIGSKNQSTKMPDSAGDCGTPASCTNIGTITVSDADCIQSGPSIMGCGSSILGSWRIVSDTIIHSMHNRFEDTVTFTFEFNSDGKLKFRKTHATLLWVYNDFSDEMWDSVYVMDTLIYMGIWDISTFGETPSQLDSSFTFKIQSSMVSGHATKTMHEADGEWRVKICDTVRMLTIGSSGYNCHSSDSAASSTTLEFSSASNTLSIYGPLLMDGWPEFWGDKTWILKKVGE